MDKRIFKPGETNPEDEVDAFLIDSGLMEKLAEATGYWQDAVGSADNLKTVFEKWMANKLSDKEFISEALWPIQRLVELQKALRQSSVVMSAHSYFNPNL